MDWFDALTTKPPRKFGWFAVAMVPTNHSGSSLDEKCSLKGDNEWRADFGFTKAWLNNDEWYEPSATGYSTNNITRYVTHWSELPSVPELQKSFHHPAKYRFKEKPGHKELRKIAEEHWTIDQKTNPTPVNPHAYSYGFMAAFRLMGIR